jgi:membrane-associated protease RseP (regulator of RpoE activity)
MWRIFLKLFIAVICLFTSSCAHSVYSTWGTRIKELSVYGKVDDISLLLGSPPNRCEPLGNSRAMIALKIDKELPIVASVWRNGPAYQSGIRQGDIIKSIDGQPVSTPEQIDTVFKSNTQEGQKLSIETNRGTVSVVPKTFKGEQCYWDIQAGRVESSGSYASVNRYGGSSSSGSSARERFFRASCRALDRFLDVCTWNWQQ